MRPTLFLGAWLLLLRFAELGGSSKDCRDSDEELVRRFREGCPIIDGDVKCALRRQKEIQEWLSKNNKFRILITGKMGTGKTTLVKGLKERFVPEEDHLEAHTVKVTPYEHEYDQVDFFFDTPGLKDAVNGSNDYSYLEDMVKNNENPDLIVFTMKMDDALFRQEDVDAIENITHAFGWKIWKNAMIVLTFANKVSKPGHSVTSRENRVHFNKVKDDFTLEVIKTLIKYNVPEDVANAIPVIPVGLVSQPYIKSDGRKITWIKEFWDTLFQVLKCQVSEPDQEKSQSSQKDSGGTHEQS